MNQTKNKRSLLFALAQSNAFLTSAFLESFLFSLLVILLPTQLGKHFWPDSSFVYSLKIDYLAIKIYFWDLLVYPLFIVFLIRKNKINHLANLTLILFMFLSGISIFSENVGVATARLVNWIPAGLFGLYIASKESLYIQKQLTSFLPVGILFSGCLALLQLFYKGTIGFWFLGERSFDLATPGIATFNWYGQIFLRPYATFPHPNVLGAYMLLTGLILFFLSSKNSRYFLITQLTVILTILTTFSRSVIGIYLPLVVFLFRKQYLYLGFVIIFLAPLLFVRFDSAFNFDKLSLVRREELTENAFALIEHNPWIGVGLNNYIPTAVTSSFLTGTNRFLQPVHNIFLLTLVETGIIGFTGLFILLGAPLFINRSDWLLTKPQVVTLFLIIGFLGMIDHYLLTLAQGQRLLFLVWGLAWTKKVA